MKRKFNRALIGVALFFMATTFALLFALSWQYDRLHLKHETVRELAKEITWQKYRASKAALQVRELPEYKYLVQVMETRDRDLFDIAKAAWKWGAVYKINPFLIMAVAHKESNFNPYAQSYVNGQPCAYGIMQINHRVWKDELSIDFDRIFETDYNVKLGAIILRHYLDRNPGDVGAALWEYWGRGESYKYSPMVLGSKFYDAPKGVSK